MYRNALQIIGSEVCYANEQAYCFFLLNIRKFSCCQHEISEFLHFRLALRTADGDREVRSQYSQVDKTLARMKSYALSFWALDVKRKSNSQETDEPGCRIFLCVSNNG